MQIDLTSEETGEIFDSFEVEDEEFERWEKAAAIEGVPVEEFIRMALLAAIEKYRPTEDVVD